MPPLAPRIINWNLTRLVFKEVNLKQLKIFIMSIHCVQHSFVRINEVLLIRCVQQSFVRINEVLLLYCFQCWACARIEFFVKIIFQIKILPTCRQINRINSVKALYWNRSPIKRSARLSDSTLLLGSWWPLGDGNKTQWLTFGF